MKQPKLFLQNELQNYKLIKRESLAARIEEFINECHVKGGLFGRKDDPECGSSAGTPGGSRAGEIDGIPGTQLAAAKPSAMRGPGSDYKTGDVTRLGLDTIPDGETFDAVVQRISAIPGFEDFAGRNDRAVLTEIAERQSEHIEDMYDIAQTIDCGGAIAAAASGDCVGTSKAHADWYPWVNRWAHEEGDRSGFPPEAIMAATAALSPSTDWPSNVAWATATANAIRNQDTIVVTKEMLASQEAAALSSHQAKIKIHERENAKLIVEGKEPKPFTIKPPVTGELTHLEGKTLAEVTDPTEAAKIIRGIHEADGKSVKQLGGMAGLGDPNNKAKPQSFPNMAKAISILRNPTPENIDTQLGGNHKVRSFFQNMRDPFNTKQADVTVDSHHIGLAIGLPVTGESTTMKSIYDVPTSRATGLVGTYPITVEATRMATERINKKHGTNYTPNQVQSITWEAQRALYDKKPAAMIERIGNARSLYRQGKIPKSEMLARVENARLEKYGRTPKNKTLVEVRAMFVDELKKGTG